MNTVIFDLDGTLLPMDQQEFMEIYMKLLAKKMHTAGFEPKKLVKSIWDGTNAMAANDGSITNERRFWNRFNEIYGSQAENSEQLFEEFYANEFHMAKSAARPTGTSKEIVELLRKKGYKMAVATNPLFPKIATRARLSWAGLKPEDFELVTTYENSSYCKPSLDYYQSVLDHLGKKPEECLMVGNDVQEDMCIGELGVDTFLINDSSIINPNGVDISIYKQGSLDDFLEYVKQLPKV